MESGGNGETLLDPGAVREAGSHSGRRAIWERRGEPREEQASGSGLGPISHPSVPLALTLAKELTFSEHEILRWSHRWLPWDDARCLGQWVMTTVYALCPDRVLVVGGLEGATAELFPRLGRSQAAKLHDQTAPEHPPHAPHWYSHTTAMPSFSRVLGKSQNSPRASMSMQVCVVT